LGETARYAGVLANSSATSTRSWSGCLAWNWSATAGGRTFMPC